MSELTTLQEAAHAVDEDSSLETVENLVDALVDIGYQPKVYAKHDDFIGLKRDLSDEFLKQPLDSVDEEKFEDEIQRVVDEANIILPLSQRVIDEDDQEEIDEEMRRIGIGPDDGL